MNWFVAFSTGTGLGLACFGGLWFTIRHSLRSPGCWGLILASSVLRWTLAGVTFSGLLRHNAGMALVALAGFWSARLLLIKGMREAPRGF